MTIGMAVGERNTGGAAVTGGGNTHYRELALLVVGIGRKQAITQADLAFVRDYEQAGGGDTRQIAGFMEREECAVRF